MNNIQWTLALRYLWGRKVRSILTTLAIVFGVMITFGMNGMVPAIQAAFGQNMALSAHAVDLILSHETGNTFDASQAEIVRGTPGVRTITPVLERSLLLPADLAIPTVAGGTLNRLTINGWDASTAAGTLPFQPVAGRWLEADEGAGVMVRESFLAETGRQLGDRVRVPGAEGVVDFEIVGVLPARPVLGDEELFMSLAAAQRIFNAPGQINAIAGQFEEGADGDAVRALILERLGEGYQAGSIGAGGSEWETALQMANLVFTLFGVLALGMGGFIMFNTFRTVVVERKHDIGMLRAVGASRRTVLGLILIEGLIQGIIGTALGMIVGFLLIRAMLPLLNPTWEQFFGAPLGDPSFSLWIYIVSIGLGLGIPLLSGYFPARAASRISPLEALRPAQIAGEEGSSRRRVLVGGGMIGVALLGLITGNLALISVGVLLFLAGIVVISPVLVRPVSQVFNGLLALIFAREGSLAQGNLQRQPGRAAITASTIAISLAILVALGGLTTTLTDGMMNYLDQSMRADYMLLPEALVLGTGGNVGAGPELAAGVRNTPGIAAVTTVRQGNAQVDGLAAQVIGVDPQNYAQLAGLIFSAGSGETAYLRLDAGRYAIINGMLASQKALKLGDSFSVQTVNGTQEYEVVGVGLDYLNSKVPSFYISHDNLAADYRQVNDVLLMANRSPDANRAAVESALGDLLVDYPAFSLFSYDRWRAVQLEGNMTRTYALYVLMVLLAIPSLLALANTLGINVLERTREIGVLRAIGGTRRQVQRMIIAESLLLSALGIAFGILAGIWLGYVIVGVMNVSGFIMPYSFPYLGIVLTVAIGLIFGVLAALLPARHAAQLNIVGALKYE
ncbi:MAG: ABC transporter permease [Caldilineaceae bacterium]|nr:ABC transporter permease [Caldilineaceae bacterium]